MVTISSTTLLDKLDFGSDLIRISETEVLGVFSNYIFNYSIKHTIALEKAEF